MATLSLSALLLTPASADEGMWLYNNPPFKRLGLGRRTQQFNPEARGAESYQQWALAVMSMKGESDAMTVPAAVDMIRATPPEDRSRFAREIWGRRREHWGESGRYSEVPF